MSEPFDSRRLYAFQVLARTGSFTQTARELRLTQSGISHSIKTLETEAGCRLLDRLGKKVVLTPAGGQFLQHAEKILGEMESARETLTLLKIRDRGRLRLGADLAAMPHLVPRVLREFKKIFPGFVISLEPGDAPELADSLLRRRIDLALTLEAERDQQLKFHSLFKDELQFIVSALHPWAQARRVDRAQIPRQNFILHTKRDVIFRFIEHYFRRENMVLNTVIEVGSIEAVKELVKLGLGVSILPPWVAAKEIGEGSLVTLPLGRKRLERHWGILHWRDRRLSLAEETFIGLCESATVPMRNRPTADT